MFLMLILTPNLLDDEIVVEIDDVNVKIDVKAVKGARWQ